LSEQEFQRLLDVIDTYFRPKVTVVDAADAVAKIRVMRPDLNDKELAKAVRVSPASMSVLLRIPSATPEERERMKGSGIMGAFLIIKESTNRKEEKKDDNLPTV
jgi:hypothetical protein